MKVIEQLKIWKCRTRCIDCSSLLDIYKSDLFLWDSTYPLKIDSINSKKSTALYAFECCECKCI